MEHCSHPSSSSMLPVPVVDPLCHSRRNRHLAFSPWSGTPVCSPLVFCKLFCVWRCIPDVSMERDVLHVHLLLHHPHLTFIVVTSSCFLTVSSSKCASFNYGSVLPPLKKANILPLIMHKFFLHCFLFLSFYCLRKPGHLTAVFPTVWILLAAHSWDSSVRSSALCVRCPWSAGSRGSTRASFCPFDKALWVPAPAASLLDVLSRGGSGPGSITSLGGQHGDIHSFHCAVVHILLLINFVIAHNL